MQEKIVVTLSNGHEKEISLPKFGEIKFVVRNGKVTNIKIEQDEKIC